jgi:hypothetical protein
MRVITALALLGVCLSLGGCSRPNQTAHAKPHPTKVTSVKSASLPVRKRPEPTKVMTAKHPPLPAKNPLPATAEAKFEAVQVKAKKLGVHQLTQEDIEGLSYDQIKQLRGY